jgi:hypothetical protein
VHALGVGVGERDRTLFEQLTDLLVDACPQVDTRRVRRVGGPGLGRQTDIDGFDHPTDASCRPQMDLCIAART